MSILYELRYPTKWYMKLVTAVLALIFFAVLATVAIAGFLVYRIVKPQRTSSEIDMESFPGKPDLVDFTVAGIGVRAWLVFSGIAGSADDHAVPWIRIEPRRSADAGFGIAGPPVQRVCV